MKTYQSPYIILGTIVKTYGIKGEVLVASNKDLPLLLRENMEAYIIPPQLQSAPVVHVQHIEAESPCLTELVLSQNYKKLSTFDRINDICCCARQARIKFREIHSLSQAQQLVGKIIVAHNKEVEPHALQAAHLIDFSQHTYTVKSASGDFLGYVESITEGRAHQLSMWLTGRYNNLSIPYREEFLQLGPEPFVFIAHLPDGYLELYEEVS